jgi:hypothetical protein
LSSEGLAQDETRHRIYQGDRRLLIITLLPYLQAFWVLQEVSAVRVHSDAFLAQASMHSDRFGSTENSLARHSAMQDARVFSHP